MKEYRLTKISLINEFIAWDNILRRKVNLIACGGTALTLLNVKESTKDVDLIIPSSKEYKYLINVLKQAGYKSCKSTGWKRDDSLIIFDIFVENRIHTTELIESPLKKSSHIDIKKFRYIQLGVLNYYDILISKLFRASSVDFQDCIELVKSKQKEIDFEYLKARYHETALYNIATDRMNKHLDSFLMKLQKEGLING
jgi:hypothetical protein